jgi:pimeloyl-ACP methyl ester carboxylesterase
MKRYLFHFAILLITTCLRAQVNQKTDYGNNPAAGKYCLTNGMRLYYETYGSGKPLLLLHGNGGSIRKHAKKIEYFRNYFQVIAIDSRAHGKSIDTSSTLTYEQMAADISVLLDSLKLDSVYIWGQSDGGILALLLAIHYPKKVSKISAFGANIFPGPEAIYKELDDWIIDTLKHTKNPRTRKLFSLLEYQPHISPEELKKIKCQVLIMAGDRDAIRTEHTQLIFDHIKNSNLFIMPGATHVGSYEKTELFNMVLLDFLQKPFTNKSSVELFLGKK